MHVGPFGQWALLETIFGFSIGVRAETPLRVAIVIRVQHDIRLKRIAREICPVAFPCDRAVLAPKLMSSIRVIPSRGAQARR
jgi:hypothetical protein